VKTCGALTAPYLSTRACTLGGAMGLEGWCASHYPPP
jgi:hypothetical protein